jgi:hypothetical protein
VSDGADFQPKPLVFGEPVEVVDDERLVCASDVVEVVEDQEAISICEVNDSLDQALVLKDPPMQVVRLGSAEAFEHLLRTSRRAREAAASPDASREWGGHLEVRRLGRVERRSLLNFGVVLGVK